MVDLRLTVVPDRRLTVDEAFQAQAAAALAHQAAATPAAPALQCRTPLTCHSVEALGRSVLTAQAEEAHLCLKETL